MLPFPVRKSKSTAVFDIINCDVWGPYKATAYGHCNQFLTIVDDFVKCTWLFLCSAKSKITSLHKYFVNFVFTQFHKTIKIVKSDNCGEFANQELRFF